MGNAPVVKSRETKNAISDKGRTGGKPQKPVGKLPPLHVVKDSAAQTEDDGTTLLILRTGALSISSLIILASVIYFGICYALICSNYVQSLVVYSNYVKEDLPLQNLLQLGLPEAKNIEIITEDGVLLRGWHLMHPGESILQANNLPEEERNIFFDQQMAHASRIVLYFHGNSHTRAQGFRLRTVKQMAVYLNAHVIAVDYRGFADSDGHPSEDGTHLDARAVIQYVDNIVRRYNPAATGYLVPALSVGQEDLPEDEGAGGLFSQFFGLLESHKDYLASKMAQAMPTDAAIGAQNGSTILSGEGSVASAESTVVVDRESKGSLPLSQPAQPHLFIYGHSLGAAISTAIAVEISNLKSGALTGLILDSPFTTLPNAIRTHPLTAPFRIFPSVFNIMMASLQFYYPNIERIHKVSAPLLFLHGDHDIKIDAAHSRELFLKATGATALVNESSTAQFGFNVRNVTFFSAPRSAGASGGTGRGGGKGSGSGAEAVVTQCSYPVERHVLGGSTGHLEVYAHRAWLGLVPDFIRRAEQFAADSAGTC